MKPSANQPAGELDRLVHALCDRSISDDDFLALQELVVADSALRLQYIERMNLHAALGWNRPEAESFGDSHECDNWPSELVAAVASRPRSLPINPHVTSASRGWVLASTALVAAVFYGVFAALVWNLQPFFVPAVDSPNDSQTAALAVGDDGKASEEYIARLISAEGCEWGASGESPRLNARLGSQTLQLIKGTAEIAFASGVHAVFEGPCTFELRSPSAAFLTAGRISANVPPPAIGFTVETPSAKIVDLGTEFGVEVSSASSTTVHVFSGKVHCEGADRLNTDSASTDSNRVVRAGQSVEIARSSVGIELASATHSPEKYATPANRKRVSYRPHRLIHPSASAVATQSSEYVADVYGAAAALDGDVTTFSHTSGGDAMAWWQLDIGETREIAAIVLQNRIDCCGGRLRDVVVKILADDGQNEVFASQVLNANNGWGGGVDNYNSGPAQLVVDLQQLHGSAVAGRHVRVERAISANISDEPHDNNLSLAEVQLFELGKEKANH